MGSACVIVPALDAATTIGTVVSALRSTLHVPIYVVDDGSVDLTASTAENEGATVLRHAKNLAGIGMTSQRTRLRTGGESTRSFASSFASSSRRVSRSVAQSAW